MTKDNRDNNNKQSTDLSDNTDIKDSTAPSLKDTMASVGSAMIGIQSNKNRERDFSQGKFSHFILVGIFAVILFISALVLVVNLVLPD